MRILGGRGMWFDGLAGAGCSIAFVACQSLAAMLADLCDEVRTLSSRMSPKDISGVHHSIEETLAK